MLGDGRLPAVDETLTIDPLRRARACRAAPRACARTALIRFSSHEACQSSSVSSSNLRMLVPADVVDEAVDAAEPRLGLGDDPLGLARAG